MTGIIIGLFGLLYSSSFAQENLLKNADFEEPLQNEWKCLQCTLKQVAEPFEGGYSGQISDRSKGHLGLGQIIGSIKQKTNYAVGGRIRLLNSTSEYSYLRINVQLFGEKKSVKKQVALLRDVRRNEAWVEIDGDFQTESDTKKIEVSFLAPSDEEIEFLVDATYLFELRHDPNWRSIADKQIERIRKGNLIIELKNKGDCKYNKQILPNSTFIQINQTKAGFPFGSAMQATVIQNQKYQNYFYSLFNWATPVNSLKWRFTERQQGQVDFSNADELINILLQHGISIRGHCIAWDKAEKIMPWLNKLNSSDISRAVKRRIQYIIKYFSGRVGQWDVNNEILAQQWYEKRTGNPQFSQAMLQTAHLSDPNATLFLNEYNIINNGQSSSGYRRKAAGFLANGVPVKALGIQSHIGLPGNFFDVDLFKRRLDMVAQVGLPLWITEFDLEWPNVTERAGLVEDALRLFFSHPAVEGIVLWGFWSETNNLGERNASLVDGEMFKENEVGAAVRRLYREAWWTKEQLMLEDLSRPQTHVIRVFHGNHIVTVEQNGDVVWQGSVQVHKGEDTRLQIELGCVKE